MSNHGRRARYFDAAEDQANAMFTAGDVQGAESLLGGLFALPGAPSSLSHNLGLLRFQLGDYAGAVDAYTRSIPDIPEGRVNRGLSYEELGLIAAARSDYETYLSEQPEDIEALVNLGTLELELRNNDSALKLLTFAASIDATVNWQVSDALLTAGRVEAAHTALCEAVIAGERRALTDLLALSIIQDDQLEEQRVRQQMAQANFSLDGDNARLFAALSESDVDRRALLSRLMTGRLSGSLMDALRDQVGEAASDNHS